MTRSTRFALLATTVALLPLQAAARETVTLWFWGASPEYREALETTLVQPFHDAQDTYDLVIEYKNDVDNDVRVSVMAGEGPDIVYTSVRRGSRRWPKRASLPTSATMPRNTAGTTVSSRRRCRPAPSRAGFTA